MSSSADVTESYVRITDADGTVATYGVAHKDGIGRSPFRNKRGLPSIPLEALSGFFCLSSGGAFAVPDADKPWTMAPLAGDDPGCIHGVKHPPPCGKSWVKIKVSEAGAYGVSAAGCVGTNVIHLHSPDGESELAVSAPATAPACAAIEHHFDAAGIYVIAFERISCATEPQAWNYFKMRVSRP